MDIHIMEKKIVRRTDYITTIYKDIYADKLIDLINNAKKDIINQYPESAAYNIKVLFRYDIDNQYDYESAILSIEYFRKETDIEYNDRINIENAKRRAELEKIYKEVDTNKEVIIEYLKQIGFKVSYNPNIKSD